MGVWAAGCYFITLHATAKSDLSNVPQRASQCARSAELFQSHGAAEVEASAETGALEEASARRRLAAL